MTTLAMHTGGNRQLDKALECVKTVAESMTRIESRAITMVLEGILEAKQRGVLEKVTTALAGETQVRIWSLFLFLSLLIATDLFGFLASIQ